MSTRTVLTGPTPQVLVEAVYGDLQIKGWDRPEVLIKSSTDESSAPSDQTEIVYVRSMGDCQLQIPLEANLTVKSVHGDAQMMMLESRLEIGRVLGSLSLRDVAETKIDSIYGEFKARHIAGDLSVNQVLGNADIRDVHGSCMPERVAGNLDLRNIDGEVSASAGGNARVSLDIMNSAKYRVDCGGDLTFSVPENSDAQVTLTCGSGKIYIKLPDEKNIYPKRIHHLTMGNGKARIDLTAGGMITFGAKVYESSQPEESEAEQMEGAAAAQAALWSAHAERISRHAQEASERASARAQERMQRAQERLSRKLAAAQRKMDQRTATTKRGKENSWSSSGAVPVATPGPASPARIKDEEQMAILRMLEQKKITLEEAEMLLATLEEKGE